LLYPLFGVLGQVLSLTSPQCFTRRVRFLAQVEVPVRLDQLGRRGWKFGGPKRGGGVFGVKKGGYFGGQKRGLFGGPKRVIFGVQKPPLVYSEKRSNPPHVSDHELPHFGQKTAPGGINSTPFWTPQKRGIFDPFLTLFWGTPKKGQKGVKKGGGILGFPQKDPLS
jgi:hypothetical protein